MDVQRDQMGNRKGVWCAIVFLAVYFLLVHFLLPEQASAEPIKLKLSTYISPNHQMCQYLTNWAKLLEKKSGGRLQVDVFHGCQMGPPQRQYDLVRTGVADIAWFMHGATPGRFPLTELIQMPFVAGSAEIAAKTLCDPELLQKYLAAEHKGVKVLYLFSAQPQQILTRKAKVAGVEDFKGLRIRFSSPGVKDFLDTLGATPVGVPAPAISEMLQKGTIDAAGVDYGGAYTAFKLGGLVKYSTEIYFAVTSFGVAMNPKSYNKLPPDLQKLIDDTTHDAAGEIGWLWDASDAPGKKYLVSEGTEIVTPSPGELQKLRQIAADVAEVRIKSMETSGLPARQVYQLMRSKADEYAKTATTDFWK